MSDGPPSSAAGGVTRAAAEAAVAGLHEHSRDLRGCVVLGPGGVALAASGDPERWGEAARELLVAADAAAGRRAGHAHVGIEDGEAFAVRDGELAIVAVAGRFTLASLMLSDIRAALRGLAAGTSAADDDEGVAGEPVPAGRREPARP